MEVLIDCVPNELSSENDKLVWIVILVFTHFIGALVYYFVRRRPGRFAERQRLSRAQQRQP